MKKIALFSVAVLALFACGGTGPVDPVPEPEPEPEPETVSVPAFATGSDVSWLSEMEKDGKSFSDDNGNTDLLAILKALGQNSIRLRVWVNPDDPGGWSGKADVVKQAKRAAAAGMAVLIDFHYSDFFADPGRQVIPSAWTDHTVSATAECIKAHTEDVLGALKDAGVSPAWVQVGNEITNGMDFPVGRLWNSGGGEAPNGWASLARLTNAGYYAVKGVFPDAKVIVHVDNAFEDRIEWFGKFFAAGGKLDVIGLSHYPQTNSSYTPSQMNSLALANIKALVAKYGKDVMVVETGVKSSDFTAGAACISEFMAGAKALDGLAGVFYWEPEVYGGWKPAIYDNIPSKYSSYSSWGPYDMGAFTSAGKPSEALKALK